MLKTDSLPSAQTKRNDLLGRGLGRLSVFAGLLALVTVAGFGALIWFGTGETSRPGQTLSEDGTPLGYAAIFSPNNLLIAGDAPDRILVRSSPGSKVEARKVRSETLPGGIVLNLYHCEDALPEQVVPSLGNVDTASKVQAPTAGGVWSGSASAHTGSSYLDLDPAAGLSPGGPAFQNQLLIGVVSQTEGRFVLVPVPVLSKSFKELAQSE